LSKIAVIGCGVTGAAAAYKLSMYDDEIVIIEKENDVADGTTKANSAIIHAGYDPEPGTLMAKLNVEGTRQAEEICRKLDVPYRRTGSYVLAFSAEEEKVLERLLSNAEANGVPGAEIITGEEARRREPALSEDVKAALWAQSAGIINPWEYCIAMAETAVRNGAELMLDTEVTGIERLEKGFRIKTSKGDVTADYVINAAGVDSGRIHEMAAPKTFNIVPTKGEYYVFDKEEGDRVGAVIFQCPTSRGKGVLVSPTVDGNLIVGPNAVPCDADDLSVTASGLSEIRAAGAKSVPGVNYGAAIRNFAGVRANSDAGDFIISMACPGFLDLAGICSPGLSSAPAIADMAIELLEKDGLVHKKKENAVDSRRKIRFREMGFKEREELVKSDPAYGRVICRCETVTEGEIRDALESPIPARTLDGVKRRCGTGMGRCQGGFCGPRIVEILAEKYGVGEDMIEKDRTGSRILTGETKGGSVK
jgi:glycerol-3-phosphate dehydrogenase